MTVGQSCSMACTSSCRYTRWGFLWMGWAWPSFFFLIGPSLYLEWSIPILTSFSMVCLGMLNGASLSWMVHVLMCMIWGGVWRVKSEGWIWRGRAWGGGSRGAESEGWIWRGGVWGVNLEGRSLRGGSGGAEWGVDLEGQSLCGQSFVIYCCELFTHLLYLPSSSPPFF